MKLSKRIFKDNLPSNSIVQSYEAQICNAIEEGMWKMWKHCNNELSKEPTEEFKRFINKQIT